MSRRYGSTTRGWGRSSEPFTIQDVGIVAGLGLGLVIVGQILAAMLHWSPLAGIVATGLAAWAAVVLVFYVQNSRAYDAASRADRARRVAKQVTR